MEKSQIEKKEEEEKKRKRKTSKKIKNKNEKERKESKSGVKLISGSREINRGEFDPWKDQRLKFYSR